MNEENYTTIRISRESLKIIRRYAKIHNLTLPAFLDNLSCLLVCGIDNLDNMEIPINELQKLYRYSSLLVSADMRQVVKPIREPARKEALLEVKIDA